MTTPQKITLFLLFAAFILSSPGCCNRLHPDSLFVAREKTGDVSLDNPEKTVQSEEIETILQTGGRARRLTPSPDSRRVLIERQTSFDETPSVVDSGASNPSSKDDELNVELWNLEFSTAKQEDFRTNEYLLALQKSNAASFSAEGDRLFWLAREPVYDDSQDASNVNVASNVFFNAAPSFELRNVVLTKPLGASSFESKNESDVVQTSLDASVKHVKTVDEIKTAPRLRLSPNARWLIYRSLKDASSATVSNEQAQTSTSGESDVDFLYDVPSWRLVYVADRKRVVHFPDAVKMTFDSSTSDETIEGRVVEILDVSDKGDLVATLVEELPQAPKNDEKAETSTVTTKTNQAQNWNPRYKIVIWDLEVVRTVDLEKKRSPLFAIEVSQIPVKIPLAPGDCHFSTDGKVLAAKVEPRSISVWQTANGRLKGEFWEDDGYIRDFTLAANGMRLVACVGDREGKLLLWDVRTCALKKELRFPQTRSIDAAAFFHSDESVLFVDSEGVVKRWRVDADSFGVDR